MVYLLYYYHFDQHEMAMSRILPAPRRRLNDQSLLYPLCWSTHAARSIAEDLTCPQNETRIKTFRCEKDCYHVGPILTWHSVK